MLDISGNNLQASGAITIGNFLQNIYTPKTLFITNTNNPADVDVSAVISDNASLQEIYIYNNNLQTTEVEIFTKPLQAICTLSKLHIGYNNISDEVANDIAIIVSCNTNLNEVEISGNKLQTTGAIKILKSLHKIYALKILILVIAISLKKQQMLLQLLFLLILIYRNLILVVTIFINWVL